MENKDCKRLHEYIEKVQHIDENAIRAAKDYNSKLVKPPRSMGELESIAVRLAGITGTVKNKVLQKKVFVLCADNGVVREKIASSPVSVTAAQAVNMTKGVTGMSVLARHVGAEVTVVDVGIATDYEDLPGSPILNRKIRKGTGNIAREPAMTEEECLRAIITGIELAAYGDNRRAEGQICLVGVGEMGVGNTTTSTALLAALTGADSDIITGRGAGLTDDGFIRKKKVIKKALELHGFKAGGIGSFDDVIRAMARLGGLDIAAMCGVFIGAALMKKAAVIDGLISAVAALCAVKLCPEAMGYLFASHLSKEPGYELAIKELGLRPYLSLDMGLGEGSGCVIAFQVIEDACAMMNDMATFESGGIDDSYLDGIRSQSADKEI